MEDELSENIYCDRMQYFDPFSLIHISLSLLQRLNLRNRAPSRSFVRENVPPHHTSKSVTWAPIRQ